MVSAGLMATHQKKLDRYALLAALAERQTQDGLRTSAPMILPVAVSTHGEFCPGAVRLQEWLTEKYRARVLLEGDRDDGQKPETLTTAFRQEFRSSLLVASCKGLADMLAAAGMPFAGKHVFRPPPTATAAPPAAARSRDADESNDEDFSSEEESSSEEEDEENEEGAGDAGSSADLSDHPQQEEEADSPNLWDNGPVMPLACPPLAPDRDPIPSTERPRRTPSARLVDDSGLARFVPRAEADGWAAAIAATAGPGPRSTSLGFASQHAQGMTLFERFFSNSHPPS
jgi:hypothetical protein